MSEIFRPADFWKSAIMTMADNSFYELLRSVFGKIKTPFNKQQLLNDLETFLLRDDIQKTITAYIDETDTKIISAIALFKEPDLTQLENFFMDELSPAQLQDIIVNLEERFIIYRFTEKKTEKDPRTISLYGYNTSNKAGSYLALNPILKQILLPITSDTSALFPTVKKVKNTDLPSVSKSRFNDLTLAALFSFISGKETFYKSENVIRRRIIEEAKTLFPGFDLKVNLGALQILGLFYIDNDKLLPDRKRFDDFGQLSARERIEYFTAALLVYNELTPPFEILPPLFRNKIRDIVKLIHHFLDFLKDGSLYNIKTLKRIFEVLKSQTTLNIVTDILLDTLENTGLIINTSPELYQFDVSMQKKAASDNPVIAVNSGSSIFVYPEINFEDVINLASVMIICEASTVVRFELDRDAVVRAFNSGITADEIIELITRLSGGKAGDSIIWNIKDWEKRYNEVSLKKGVILQLAEDRRYLAETRSIASLINETITPGVYLLNENNLDKAIDSLHNAGVEIIAQGLNNNSGQSRMFKKDLSNKYLDNLYPTNYFSSPSVNEFNLKLNLENNSSAPAKSKTKDNTALIEGFHKVLDKMLLNETEKKELTARIDRKLVLHETQLKEASVRYEKLEARHMDYTGKQNIAKQAISQQSPVEVVLSVKNKENRIFGTPQALEKEGNELILVIGSDRIPLAKISLLRRIKKSIFEK
ncbi:MAG: helicase-associated domain-containing protein [Treponema sp.]|nr:helicase-associated domain-containing protein [Treponema sp.]